MNPCSIVQDGYFCVQRCEDNVRCLGNFTKSIVYQFTALPSIKFVREPFPEVTRIRAENVDREPFYVKYEIEERNRNYFGVEQQSNIGQLRLVSDKLTLKAS